MTVKRNKRATFDFSGEKPEWKKILYRRQPYPDNYSGGERQFLKELRKNVSVVHYDYKDATIGATHLMFHMDAVVLYIILFLNVLHEVVTVPFIASLFMLILPLYVFNWTYLSEKPSDLISQLKTIATLLLFGYAFTPVIRTLTTTISTDTIYAVAILSAIISCMFHDYGVKAPIVSYPISLSSGLSSAIFLLSRLKSDFPAFLLLVAAFILHAYGAEFRNRLFAVFPKLALLVSLFLSVYSIALLVTYSKELSCLWFILHIFIVFVCPYILIKKQTGKCTIHGPWDEAVPAT
ncbi:unnamed protein product [Caenorhabditis auriculariae]|uniref:Phosphatidylinositol N-acetylglucosaminyltransferase subunit C n=1 Tax=Caenorhabditis auriculariae TaxID=2777116 RepID=A0A8S1HDU2_9PELO|nr:unnamed protein product [Caenorhabditis auriculariae]